MLHRRQLWLSPCNAFSACLTSRRQRACSAYQPQACVRPWLAQQSKLVFRLCHHHLDLSPPLPVRTLHHTPSIPLREHVADLLWQSPYALHIHPHLRSAASVADSSSFTISTTTSPFLAASVADLFLQSLHSASGISCRRTWQLADSSRCHSLCASTIIQRPSRQAVDAGDGATAAASPNASVFQHPPLRMLMP